MTTTQTDESQNTGESTSADSFWGARVASLAGTLASENFPPGHLAQLRRMNPDDPDAAPLWRLMVKYDLFRNDEVDRKWALIIHGIALMTPTNSGTGDSRSAHDRNIPVGRALFLGGESQRTSAFYRGTRLNRLLHARDSMFRALLARMFRMLAANRVSFDWITMASLILNEGYNEEAAERERRRIARDYYQAERDFAQANTD